MVKTKKCFYLRRSDPWLLPVAPIAKELNPFSEDKVYLSAVLFNHLPYENVKFLTALGLLRDAEESGKLEGVHTLVEATSGNTGVALASLARSFGGLRVQLVVLPDLPDGKRYPLLLSGAEIIHPEDGFSPVSTARKLGLQEGFLNLDQYSNPAGTRLHRLFTAPKIFQQTTFRPTVIVGGIGTGGTLIGIRDYVSAELNKPKIVGVLLKRGDEIPGIRDSSRMEEVLLPWKKATDRVVEIETKPSYLAALWFNWTSGITPGPSSGLAYLGALKYLQECKRNGTLDSLRDKYGKIHAVILFPDGNRPYGDRFMANLPYNCLKVSTAPLPWQFPGHELW